MRRQEIPEPRTTDTGETGSMSKRQILETGARNDRQILGTGATSDNQWSHRWDDRYWWSHEQQEILEPGATGRDNRY